MGQIVLPTRGPVYVDTCAIIYRVEKIEPYLWASSTLWEALDLGQLEILTSELTLLEVLVKPLRDGNVALANLFRQVLLGTIGMNSWPVSRNVLETAARIRALQGLKTPDAIHAATALEGGCSLLVTNDPVFRKTSGLNVAVLSEVAAS